LFRASLAVSSALLAIRLIVEFRAGGRFLSLLVPNSRIDGGVQQIGDQVGENNPNDHDDRDRFIQQES